MRWRRARMAFSTSRSRIDNLTRQSPNSSESASAMLQEQELKTFVEGTTNYFEVAAQQPASVGSPYLATDGPPTTHDYTGVISISGKRKGVVYFTAPRAMLTVLL